MANYIEIVYHNRKMFHKIFCSHHEMNSSIISWILTLIMRGGVE